MFSRLAVRRKACELVENSSDQAPLSPAVKADQGMRALGVASKWLWKRVLIAAAVGAFLSHVLSVAFATPLRDWPDYQIIMWQGETPTGYATLKAMGVTGAAVGMNHATGLFLPSALDSIQRAHIGFYLENMATDFYSPYHRYYEDKPPNWLYRDLKDRYRRDRSDRSVFLREPGLSDPAWLARIGDRLAANVRALGSNRPLFYNLADEPGIADLAANWDFDLSPASLDGMRSWLKSEYGSVAALNAEWNTQFATWDDVAPETTDDAMHGLRDNFAAWADFKAWMDVAFARAVAAGTSALHAADPQALSAIEGGQIPGSGGWDYSRLAGTVDVMELYDDGDNIEVVRSFAPDTILLTTSFRSGPVEEHRVWRELLRGTRGLVLWDDGHEFIAEDGTLGRRGREAAPYFCEIRGGLGALLMASERQLDPIAILYSQASMRVQWMLDRLPEGVAWIERNAPDEREDNAIRVATRTSLHQLEHAGLQPVFLSSQQLEGGALLSGGFRVLILPHAVALSLSEAAQIRDFAAHGGRVLSDGVPGVYDQHGRKLSQSAIIDLFPRPPHALTGDDVIALVRAEGLETNFPIQHTHNEHAQDVETYIFRNGDITILALLRDLHADQGAAPPEDEPVIVPLPHPVYAYNLRTGQGLGLQNQLTLSLASVAPTIIALSDHSLPPPSLSGPERMSRYIGARFHIAAAAPNDVLHVEVTDPTGRPVPAYARNLNAANAAVDFELHFEAPDPLGTWTITVRDLLIGDTASIRAELTDR